MNYRFEQIFIGTLAENVPDGVNFQGNILCTVGPDNTVFDLLKGDMYDYLGHERHKEALYGTVYVIGLYDKLPEEFGNNIFRRKTLLALAAKLNNDWASINMPAEEVKVKRAR